MLPDFPDEKRKLIKILNFYGDQKRQQSMPFLNLAQSHRHYEGSQWRTQRSDGTSSDTDYKEVQSGFSVRLDEIPHLSWEKIMQKIDGAALEMANQIERAFIRTLIQEMEDAGRVMSSNSPEPTKETFLQMLENLAVSFNETGKPNLPTMFVSPEIGLRMRDKLDDWNSDPELARQFDLIIERKKEEWRDRESRRKLVE